LRLKVTNTCLIPFNLEDSYAKKGKLSKGHEIKEGEEVRKESAQLRLDSLVVSIMHPGVPAITKPVFGGLGDKMRAWKLDRRLPQLLPTLVGGTRFEFQRATPPQKEKPEGRERRSKRRVLRVNKGRVKKKLWQH